METKIDKASPVPLYHQLAELLQQEISSGRFQSGEKIPSENVLADLYRIGRPTVRQAIDSLVRKRLLVRRRGSGTFVAETPERVDLFSLAGTMASFKASKRAPKVILVEPPRRAKVISGISNPFSGTEAIYLSRRTLVEETPVLVEDIYLDARIFAGLENMKLEGISLSQLVEDSFHFVLTGGTQQFNITYPDTRLTELLDVRKSTPLLAVNRFLDSSLQQNAIYSDLFCRTDEFIFSQSLGGLSHG
ncbi:GntR family transcriptional regulator [Desulfosediminicola ganghwensis]|uniref:GntR family transcriptional regulator n=1 Tax=Desulfosediminicola ganghwensis TaxID=2569540 RepID=UPI0010ABCAC2|nr:GntR family transcriptional regulator [Desulfosediminicola ganghwensis]